MGVDELRGLLFPVQWHGPYLPFFEVRSDLTAGRHSRVSSFGEFARLAAARGHDPDGVVGAGRIAAWIRVAALAFQVRPACVEKRLRIGSPAELADIDSVVG